MRLWAIGAIVLLGGCLDGASSTTAAVNPLADAQPSCPRYLLLGLDFAPAAGAHLQIAEHDWVAVTDGEGEFTYEGVPTGSFPLLVAWAGQVWKAHVEIGEACHGFPGDIALGSIPILREGANVHPARR